VDKAFWDRWSPANGIVFVVLLIVGFIVVGEFPAADDPAEEFTAFFVDDRGRVLAGAIIWALSLPFFLLFAGALAARVRDAGERRLSATVLGAAAAFAAMALVAIAMLPAIAHTVAGELDATVVKGLSALGAGFDVMSVVPFAVLVFAFGIAVARAGVLASWFGYASIVAAPIILLAATTWARDGFWSPYGGYYIIAIIVFFAWIVVASVLLIMRPPAASEQPLTSVPQADRSAPPSAAG
jgi:hypothetical protein